MIAARFSFQKWHDELDQSVTGLVEPDYGTDVGMIQPSRYGRFTTKPLDRGRIPGETRNEDLDRDRPPGIHLVGLIDIRHPAFTQLALDVIALVQYLAGQRPELSRCLIADGGPVGQVASRAPLRARHPAIRMTLGYSSFGLDQQRSVFHAEPRRSGVGCLTSRTTPIVQSRNRFRPSLLAR